MNINFLIFFPAVFSFILCLLAAYNVYQIYYEHRYLELIIIMTGFIIFSYLPLNHIIFTVFNGTQYSSARTILGRISIIAATSAPLLVWVAMYRLTGRKLQFRHYILISLLPLVLGYTIRSYSASWENNNWVLTYDPKYILAVNAVMLVWVLFEIVYLSIQNYLGVKNVNKIPYLLIINSWIINFFAIVVLVIERVLLNNQSRFFIIFGAVGLLIMSIGLIKNPFTIVPTDIGTRLFVIGNKETGGEIYSFNIEANENSNEAHVLFSTAMSGIFKMLEEITGQSEIPKSFGYANYTIIIEQSSALIGYVICMRDSNPLRVELKNILNELDKNFANKLTISNDEFSDIHSLIHDRLKFAI